MTFIESIFLWLFAVTNPTPGLISNPPPAEESSQQAATDDEDCERSGFDLYSHMNLPVLHISNGY